MNTLKLTQDCTANLMLAPQKDYSIFPVFGNLQKQNFNGLQMH